MRVLTFLVSVHFSFHFKMFATYSLAALALFSVVVIAAPVGVTTSKSVTWVAPDVLMSYSTVYFFFNSIFTRRYNKMPVEKMLSRARLQWHCDDSKTTQIGASAISSIPVQSTGSSQAIELAQKAGAKSVFKLQFSNLPGSKCQIHVSARRRWTNFWLGGTLSKSMWFQAAKAHSIGSEGLLSESNEQSTDKTIKALKLTEKAARRYRKFSDNEDQGNNDETENQDEATGENGDGNAQEGTTADQIHDRVHDNTHSSGDGSAATSDGFGPADSGIDTSIAGTGPGTFFF